jgi:hypothetical protein
MRYQDMLVFILLIFIASCSCRSWRGNHVAINTYPKTNFLPYSDVVKNMEGLYGRKKIFIVKPDTLNRLTKSRFYHDKIHEYLCIFTQPPYEMYKLYFFPHGSVEKNYTPVISARMKLYSPKSDYDAYFKELFSKESAALIIDSALFSANYYYCDLDADERDRISKRFENEIMREIGLVDTTTPGIIQFLRDF